MDRLAVLQKLIANARWSDFGSDPFGRGYYLDPDEKTVEILMRVGLQLGRPVRALMAEGMFLRIERLAIYDTYASWLEKLDPHTPNKCLYHNNSGSNSWDPANLFNDRQVLYQQANQQAQWNQANGPYYNPYLNNPNTWGLVAQTTTDTNSYPFQQIYGGGIGGVGAATPPSINQSWWQNLIGIK